MNFVMEGVDVLMFKYIIIEVDGIIRSPINKKGKPSKYEDPKLFETAEAAGRWIDKHSYEGMSYHYTIVRV